MVGSWWFWYYDGYCSATVLFWSSESQSNAPQQWLQACGFDIMMVTTVPLYCDGVQSVKVMLLTQWLEAGCFGIMMVTSVPLYCDRVHITMVMLFSNGWKLAVWY
jgi:hypothetical protein